MADVFDCSVAVVRRYGGTVDKFTGDGIMAVFGAPIALEDHALRACMAALEIQAESREAGGRGRRRDGVELQLRVGLNSGQVIAGEIGSAAASYTAIGEQVGMAQRMESAAPPGGVMLSESTARLVENLVSLEEPELVAIKGADAPVPREAAAGDRGASGPQAKRFAARRPNMGTQHRHSVTRRSRRQAREASSPSSVRPESARAGSSEKPCAHAAGRGVPVYTAYCESHTSDIPFQVVARLYARDDGNAGMSSDRVRAQIRARLPKADPEDLLLIDDLLGIGDSESAQPDIGPDARRRRLTALINGAALRRRSRRSSSSKTFTGSTPRASRCWPISWPSSHRCRR